MKKILGLDIGSNSIGGALIELPDDTIENYGKEGRILWMGSRIIPTDAGLLGKFETGNKLGADTPAAQRRTKRMVRRLKQRYVLRRTRLIRVMKVLGWLDMGFSGEFGREDFKRFFQTHEESSYRISDALPFSEATIREATQLLGVTGKEGKLVVPQDWIVWYLRKKALSERVTKSEFARILYMMNQRRGFKSGRRDFKEQGEENTQRQWVELVTIVSVREDTDFKPGKDGKRRYLIRGYGEETGHDYSWDLRRYEAPAWEGNQYSLLLTEKWDGKKWKFLMPQNPTADDWSLQMVSLDNLIEKEKQHPGAFFFDKLAADKNYKIRQQVVKRKRYQDELRAIWTKQQEEWKILDPQRTDPNNPLLGDVSKIEEVARTLYPSQSKFGGPKYKEILSNDLYHAVANDTIYYQRDLKSQKDSVSGCQYEKLDYTSQKGEPRKVGRKVAPISSPAFQEFRIWQDIHNLRIIETGPTSREGIPLTAEQKEKLFSAFDSSVALAEHEILDLFGLLKRDGRGKIEEDQRYELNLLKNRKELKGNETKALFRNLFKKHGWAEEGQKVLDDPLQLEHLWHIAYSIPQHDRDSRATNGRGNALKNWASIPVSNSDREKVPTVGEMPSALVNAIAGLPDFPEGYAALSTRALRKLLPLMRAGSYWNSADLDENVRKRIDHVISAKYQHDTERDTYVDVETGEILQKQIWRYRKEGKFDATEKFQGLPTFMAAYIVYGRHSEREVVAQYCTPDDIDVMKLVPKKAFNNPIVEKVIRETLCVARDVWKAYGRPDEIHIELARDLRKNSDERKKISDRNKKDREEKEHIRTILRELLNDPYATFGKRPNPYSPRDIEKFRLWMHQSESKPQELYEPSKGQVARYRLWLDQECFSPYTGKAIPLSRLFTEEYDVDHILPRSRIKSDGLDNLVVIEHDVNNPGDGSGKGSDTAYEFIHRMGGRSVKGFEILTWEAYEGRCRRIFHGLKLRNLLGDDIPNDFISRQLNDTRHITRKVAQMLAPMAASENGIVFTSGAITSDLKNVWGLTNVWKDILKPRFERLEQRGMGQFIFRDDERSDAYHFRVPDQPDFDSKRIDHRHHALDALIIAATTRGHIKYLNTLNSEEEVSRGKFDPMEYERIKQLRTSLVVDPTKPRSRKFKSPWKQENFCREVKQHLQGIIVSFKPQKPPISRPSNKSMKWVQESGTWTKKMIEQKPNPRWLAVRRSMFKQPMGSRQIKHKRLEAKLEKVFRTQLEHLASANDPVAHATSAYIYDKDMRLLFNEVIQSQNWSAVTSDIEIRAYLKKNHMRDQNGDRVEKVLIAHFVEYAAKRVAVDKSFTLDKINKIPYARREPFNPYAASEMKPTLSNVLQNHLSAYNGDPKLAFDAEGMETLEKAIGRRIKKVTTIERKGDPIKFRGQIVETDAGANVFFKILQKEGRRTYESLSVLTVLEKRLRSESLFSREEQGVLLAPGDLVYIPQEGESPQSGQVLLKEAFFNLYQVVSFSGKDCMFRPHYISAPIIPCSTKEPKTKGEIDWHDKSKNTFEYPTDHTDAVRSGESIQNRCVKVHIDRLGNVVIP